MFSHLHFGKSGWLVLAGIAFIIFVNRISAQDRAVAFEEETRAISAALGLTAGMAVADVGAGEGGYSTYLADAVGATGKLYSTEIEQDKVDALSMTLAGKSNVNIILGKHDSTELPQQCCDRILLRRVFHHLHDPESMLKSLHDALKPGAMILIVDFLPRHDTGNQDATPDDHQHGTSVDKLIHQVRHNGFELVRQIDNWPSRIIDGRPVDYAVLFNRP